MMKSSSAASVERELLKTEKPKESSPPEPIPEFRVPPLHYDPLCAPVCSLPTNFAAFPSAPAKPAPFSIRAFSEELQIELEAKGLRTPVTASVNSSQYLGSDEPPSGHFDNRKGWVKKRRTPKQALGDCYNSYKKCTRTVADSMTIIILYVILMVFASHATYLGFNNLGKCPWSPSLPSFYAALGVCSLIALTARTVLLIQRRYFPPSFNRYMARSIFSGAVVSFLILFIVQCILYYSRRHEPTTDGETACGRFFYNYIRVTNWCIPIGFVGIAILHGPISLWMTVTLPLRNPLYESIMP